MLSAGTGTATESSCRLPHACRRGGCEVPARASDAYIRSTIDARASNFEERLGQLGYCGPELIAAAVTRTLGYSLQRRGR